MPIFGELFFSFWLNRKYGTLRKREKTFEKERTTMHPIVKNFLESIAYESRAVNDIKVTEMEQLDEKQGFVVETGGNTDLWLGRMYSVQSFLGVPTVMEDLREYRVLDSFGYLHCQGTAEEVINFAKGWMSEEPLLNEG